MLSRHTKKSWQPLLWRSLLIIILILITFAVVLIISNPTPLSKDATVITVIEKPKITVGLPIRLKITVINVDAVIRYSSLTPDGAMGTPDGVNEVAWYRSGPRPGEIGSAAIAGHYGWTGDKGSVFNELHTLVEGDKISVIDENENIINFIVQKIQKYEPNADALDVFTSNDNKSHLNLITCDGTWENDKQSYSNRLIIFSDKE